MTNSATAAIAPITPSPPPPNRVPVEFIGQARVLRGKIGAEHARAAPVIEAILQQIRPRPGFTPMPTHRLMRDLVQEWEALAPFGRLSVVAVFTGKQLALAEIRCAPTAMRFLPGWIGRPEPAIAIWSIAVVAAPPRYTEQRRRLALIGLHAIARRYQRSRPADRSDEQIFADFGPLIAAFNSGLAELNGHFSIPTGEGAWCGEIADGGDAPVIAVRTYV